MERHNFVPLLATLCLLTSHCPAPVTSTSAPSNSNPQRFLPDYFQRFESVFQNLAKSRDPDFRKHVFQFQKDVAKGLNSLSSATVLEQLGTSASDLETNEEEFRLDELLGNRGLLLADNYTVNALCRNHTQAIIDALRTEQQWALPFLDALGKPPSGFLQGAATWPGAYDQCVHISVDKTAMGLDLPSFSGKYCTAVINKTWTPTIPTTTINVGLCFPDSCSDIDMDILIYLLVLQPLRRTETVYLVCHPPKEELDTKAIVAIVICSAILLCMLMGTAMDILYVQRPKWQQQQQHQHEKPHLNGHHPVTTNGYSVEESLPLVAKKTATATSVGPNLGVCSRLLLTFSVYTNGSKLLSTAQPAGSLKSIHGIRFLSMTWVVLGHAFVFVGYFSVNQLTFPMEVVKKWSFQAVANATVSVDSFFVISGLLVSYLSLKEMKKKDGRLNWFLFYFHRFWRLTPAYMLVIMVYTCLSPYWGSGPFWDGDNMGDRPNCETYWWTNLLYVNNAVHADKMCLGQSWYLANDMQFYILSPLIFVPFYFSPILGCVCSMAFLLASTITPGVIERDQGFSPGSFAQVKDAHPTEDMFTYYYMKPWNRMGPYVIGLMAGYFLYRCDCKLYINKFLNLFLWLVATGTAMGVLYGLYDASNGHPVTLDVAAFYTAVSRTVWGLCVAWVVVACCTGNGGIVDMILSWSGLVPLSRLTYCIYLLHIMLMDLYMMNQQTLFYESEINIVMFFLGILVISYMAAFVTSLAFEAPMMGLEKIIFRRDQPPKAAEQKSASKYTYTNGAAAYNTSETKVVF